MTLHRLPSGLELDLVEGEKLTPDEEAALDAYIPIVIRTERERRAALTPRERAAEPKAWRAAVYGAPRGRG